MKVGETQEMDTILAEFTTIDSIFDITFVTAEEFNMIFNFCSGVFELRLSYDSNELVQVTVEEVVLSVEYVDFADVFFPMLAHELFPHALYDHVIETGDG